MSDQGLFARSACRLIYSRVNQRLSAENNIEFRPKFDIHFQIVIL